MSGMTNSMATFGQLSLWGAFALGLTGGFGHCLAMCGPFVAGASLGQGVETHTARAAAGFQLAYHSGRLLTYGAIGAILGALGSAGSLTVLEGPWSPSSLVRYLKIGVGVGTLLLGIIMIVVWARTRRGLALESPGLLSASTVTRLGSRLSRRSAWAGLPFGMLMGLLPCGPLLPAELAALGSSSVWLGAGIMLAFGLGTVPALAGFGAASGLLGARSRGWMVPAAGLAVIALGGITVLRAATMLAA